MTDENVTKGSAPTMHVVYNASTNRQTGDVADANGNIGSGNVYDMDNRLVQPNGSTARYGYDAGNKRVWRGDTSVDEIAFWAGNQKLATYTVNSSGCLCFTLSTTNVYFGGKLVSQGKKGVAGADQMLKSPVAQDRLGSMNGKFYPYGQERPSATTNDKEKFTGYFRDASTGMDYADQRYHQSGVGRFMSPDPYGGSAKLSLPGSWNRYAYVGGDPINNLDPSGLCDSVAGGITQSSDAALAGLGSSIVQVYPYSGLGTGDSILSIIDQAAFGANSDTATLATAINNAAQDGQPMHLVLYSGSAQTFATALEGNLLSSTALSLISSVTYLSPGMFGTLPTGSWTTNIVVGLGDANDSLAMSFTRFPAGTTALVSNCSHTVTTCLVNAAQEAGYLDSFGSTPCSDPGTYSTTRNTNKLSGGKTTFVSSRLIADDFWNDYWNPASLDSLWLSLPSWGFGYSSFDPIYPNPVGSATSTIRYY